MTASPWTLTRPGGGDGPVTMVDGTSFMVAASTGVIADRGSHGLFALDTRVLSLWRVSVVRRDVESVAFVQNGPFSGAFVSRLDAEAPNEPSVIVIQRRHVGRGMREDLEIRNHGDRCDLEVVVEFDTDFAGLFEVKSGHIADRPASVATVDESGAGAVVVRPTDPETASAVTAVAVASTLPPQTCDADRKAISWRVPLGPSETWSTCLQVGLRSEDRDIDVAHPCGRPVEEAIPVGRLRAWRDGTPKLTTARFDLDAMVRRSIEDLGALRIFDPDHVDRVVVAAGAPWFMALFGRDSLIASWMALPFDQALARGVLAELADTQGSDINPTTEEEPGRILHEVRFDRLSEHLLGGTNTYYGTVDATPLFVMLAAEIVRWTGVTAESRALMPAVDRALAWIEQFGDRDGDGFVEYLRANPTGLENQGWKDSWDGIRDAHGQVAAAPIALCEVQGYVYAAYRGRAFLARAHGEQESVAMDWDHRADDLRDRFDEAYWLVDEDTYAVGLDAAKQPIRSITSNIGHLLWTGIVPRHRASAIARRLTADSMFSGWGIRTIDAGNPAFNPLSYHCGSVWPHDTAIGIAGLARYGFDQEARLITDALIDAASAGGGRLPELFGGFERSELASPVPYPTACSPQAWSAAAPLLLVRSMLGLEPDVPAGRVRCRPRLGPALGRLTLSDVPIGRRSATVTAEGSTLQALDGLGDGFEIIVE